MNKEAEKQNCDRDTERSKSFAKSLDSNFHVYRFWEICEVDSKGR